MANAIPEGYVEATWTGPYQAQILQHDGTLVDATPGDTTCIVPAGEAKASDHWRPVKADKPTLTEKAGS
jgi:hypothetical protein